MITVAELIAKLAALPQDARVTVADPMLGLPDIVEVSDVMVDPEFEDDVVIVTKLMELIG